MTFSFSARSVFSSLIMMIVSLGVMQAQQPVTIMPMGDSITAGVDYYTSTLGGYRDPLATGLRAAGISFQFVGAQTELATSALSASGEQYHNGFGSWHIADLDHNLDGVADPISGGDSNLGGYLLTGGHGTGRSAVSPNFILLEIGTNDILQWNASRNGDLLALVQHIHTLSPNTKILIAGITPINSPGFGPIVAAYNSFIRDTLVPSLSYTTYVDQNTSFLLSDGSVNGVLLGADLVHPDKLGYPVLASGWTQAIAQAISTPTNPTPVASVYTLTVNNGSGSGSYAAGTAVTVTANSPASGMQFAGWTGDVARLADATVATTVASMSTSAATITASYAAIPVTKPPASSGSVLGTYSIDSKATTQGNTVIVQYGVSAEGGTLTTYWGPEALMEIVSMGNSQYEIVETLGGRCLTSAQIPTIHQCTGAPSQLFTFTQQTDASYKIQLANATTCLTASGSFSTVLLTTCAASVTPAQSWTINGLNLGSSNPTPVASVYTLTVNNGSGSGSYAAGTAVTVTANSPASGTQFAGWTGDVARLADATAATTVATMSTSAATITASYVAIPVTTPPASSGSVLGTYSIDSKATTQGNTIVVQYGVSTEGGTLTTYWGPEALMEIVSMGNSQYEIVETLGGRCLTSAQIPTLHQCTGAPSQLFTFTQQTDASYKIQLANATTCLTASGSFSTVLLTTCAASVTPAQSWTINGLNLGSSNPTPVASVYTLTVNNGSGSGSYAAGTAVTVTANSPASGTQFAGWTGDVARLADATAATTVATMSTSAATITASYVAIPVTTPPASSGSVLGTYSIDSKATTQGNTIVVQYGVSTEGGTLTTYWGPEALMEIVSMGNSQYEIVETLGGRCLTSAQIPTLHQCTGAPSQLFTFTQQTDASYKIQLANATTCLTSAGSFSTVLLTTCAASVTPAQSWTINGLNLNPTAAGPVIDSSMVPAGYHLTFHDEFANLNISDVNGTGSNWYTHTVQCCLYDTSNPGTPTVMAGITAPDGQNPYSLINGGGLDIRLQKTNGTWYSGVLSTVDQNGAGFAQQYGYFEMKAKFPAGQGTWPAFWMLNQAAKTSNTAAGEIDIVEAFMQFPDYFNTTLHDFSLPISSTLATHLSQVTNQTNGYHIYGMLWTAATFTLYCDGVQLWQVPTPSNLNQPYYPIIDLGLGGGWPTNNTPAQNDLLVQYVRVYSN